MPVASAHAAAHLPCGWLQGRILVFSALDGKLSLVSEKETRGAVYNVLPFQGMLLTGINSRVQLYR